MSSYLRRCVALGAAGTVYPGGDQDFRSYNNGPMFQDTGTNWVRIVVDLSRLSTAGARDANGNWLLSWNLNILSALDAQIDAAKRTAVGAASGMSVILNLVGFPRWLNGTADPMWDQGNAPFNGTDAQKAAVQLYDRMHQGNTDPNAVKSPIYRFPDDRSATGAWARVFWTIAQRYSQFNPNRPSPTCWVDAMDILNEPNTMYFPQMGNSSTGDPWAVAGRFSPFFSAQMMVTASQMIASIGGRPLLVGPNANDVYQTSSRMATDVRDFTNDVLTLLTSWNFSGGTNFVWGMHNYGDVLYQDNRYLTQQQMLVNRWAGWPGGDASHPNPWLSEGGITLPNAGGDRNVQGAKVQNAWDRMFNDTTGAGAAMITNYLFNSSADFDSGLRETQTPPAGLPAGAPRPSYNAWRAMPRCY